MCFNVKLQMLDILLLWNEKWKAKRWRREWPLSVRVFRVCYIIVKDLLHNYSRQLVVSHANFAFPFYSLPCQPHAPLFSRFTTAWHPGLSLQLSLLFQMLVQLTLIKTKPILCSRLSGLILILLFDNGYIISLFIKICILTLRLKVMC